MSTATDRVSTDTPGSSFTSSQREMLRRKLLAWYQQNARDLPWRRSRDPYRVWISEIMLQQTQVATVCGYFERFTHRFPDVASLAAADEQQVLRLWEGLGYYRRARQLHTAARQVVAHHGGQFPRSVDELCRLPGIGRYTAGAIASIAYGQRAAILEANTTRLLSRLLGFRGNPLRSSGQRILWQFAADILPRKNVAHFNQALMELGSLVCTPGEPKCARCPLSSLCAANAGGLQAEIPPAKPRQQYTDIREAAVIVRRNGRLLMRQCGPAERWAGLWDFPRFAVDSEGPLFGSREITTKVHAQTGITCAAPKLLRTMKHGVTRFRITLDCYEAAYRGGRAMSATAAAVRWIRRAEIPNLPLSTTGRRIEKLIT